MNELKQEVKIQASIAAKAELNLKVLNQLLQAKEEIIINQKEIINQMKINCQFKEFITNEISNTPIANQNKEINLNESHSPLPIESGQEDYQNLDSEQISQEDQPNVDTTDSTNEKINQQPSENQQNNKIQIEKTCLKYQKENVMIKLIANSITPRKCANILTL